MNAREIVIAETATHQLSPDVRLGCGNFWDDEEAGSTAGLWVLRPSATDSQALRVSAGQQLDVPGFHLQVLEIVPREGAVRGSLRLSLEQAS